MRMKLFSAMVILSASIATPALAQGYRYYGGAPYPYGPPIYYRSYSLPPGSYPPQDIEQFWNQANFGFSGRDPSRVGGLSPNLKPSGN
jgi:hypothetical protein